MTIANRLSRAARTLFARSAREAELDEEIRFHLDAATARYRERGMSEAEARRAALCDFGAPDAAKEGARDAWTLALLSTLGGDARLALRGLRRRPAYAATVVLTIALATGAAGVIFNALWAVVVRPLPFRDDGRLAVLSFSQNGSSEPLGLSPPEIVDLRTASRTLAGVAEYHAMSFTLLGHGEPRRVRAGVVSPNYFALLGVAPEAGRDFVAGDDGPSAQPVLLLSHRFWQEELGGDPSLVGADFTMNDRAHTVIGILPPLPPSPDEIDVFMPVSACPMRSGPMWANDRTARGLFTIARLADGADAAGATRELELLTGRFAKSFPAAYPAALGLRPGLLPLREAMIAKARPTLLLLGGAALTVLLLVCANLLNLTLAQLGRRDAELAVRAALGASRARLARQLATETGVLALAGACLGLVFGVGCRLLMAGFLERMTPRATEIRMDLATVGTIFGLAIVLGLAIGIAPALLRRRSLNAGLRADGPTTTAAGGSTRTRDALVVVQVASSFVLLIGAGLLLGSLWNLERVEAGFDHQDVLTLQLPVNWTKYSSDTLRLAYLERLLRDVRGVPGVVSAALADNYPLNADLPWNRRVALGTVAPDPLEPGPTADFRTVSPNYFDTVGVPLVSGRPLRDDDRDPNHAVALVNAAFARQLLGGREPVGQQVIFGQGSTAWTIVGVVADVHQRGLGQPALPEVYAPLALRGGAGVLLVRAAAPQALLPALRRAIRALEPEQPIVNVRTLSEARAESLVAPRATAALLAVAALLALVVAAAGLAGLLAYSLDQRQREFGIRLALGATRGDIARLVLGRTGGLVGLGVGIGLGVALFGSAGLGSLLYGLAATDPRIYLGVALVLVGAAFAASLPALRRAVSTAPSVALRGL